VSVGYEMGFFKRALGSKAANADSQAADPAQGEQTDQPAAAAQ
jgi:hypothetical protein